MIATRLSGWERRLAEYIQSHALSKFDKASHECMRFTTGGILQLTGVDLGSSYKFTDEESAESLINTFQSKSFLGEVDRVFYQFGILRCTWKMMKRGDPCYFEIAGVKGLALSNGSTAITPAKLGYLQIPIEKARVCWHVP